MNSTLKKWLEELEDEINIVTSDDLNEEANSNMITFGLDEGLLQAWGKDSVVAFLESCSDLYKRKNKDRNMVFYSWLDEQAAQIRISAVSKSHGKLPFNCRLTSISLIHLVKGIYLSDSGLYTNGVLNVWQKYI